MGRHCKTKSNHTVRNYMAVGIGALAAAGYSGTATAMAQDTNDWSAVAQCESSGDWSINTGNGYYGGLQFSASTWSAYKPAGAPERADLATPAQQVQAAEAVLVAQGPGAWPVCGLSLTKGAVAQPAVQAPSPEPIASCDRVWPVDGTLTQGYGGPHDGIDIGVSIGTPVEAATSGVVSVAGIGNDPGGYGNYVQQEADSGESIQYGHLSEVYVSPGEYVGAGEIIAASGNTGSSTGPHLHLRVSSGDPVTYLSGACDTNEPGVSETPIHDEIVAEIDNAPTPIHDEIVATIGSWQEVWQMNLDIVPNPDLIFPGQVLDLPGGNTHTVAPGDTLSAIVG